jgi:hypothetical protein
LNYFGETCLALKEAGWEKIMAQAALGSCLPPEALAELGADRAHLLGEYRCGHLGHEYSRALMEFKDNRGLFGRVGGRRRNEDFFARCVAAVLLADPGLAGYTLILAVPPKLNQDPADYHLYDLAAALEQVLEDSAGPGRFEIRRDGLRFRTHVPPIKSVELNCREYVIRNGIECPLALDGRNVILLDDIVASGATSRECIRAMRQAGAGKIALIALARRVE